MIPGVCSSGRSVPFGWKLVVENMPLQQAAEPKPAPRMKSSEFACLEPDLRLDGSRQNVAIHVRHARGHRRIGK